MRRALLTLVPYAAYAVIVAFVFWPPLAHGWGSIQWDAVGVHFLNIAFSSDVLHQGVLPLWTPYIFGGFPQIADMQVALWYPPVLALAGLTRLTADGLLWEIALHYLLAASFMYLLARHLTAPRTSAWGLGLAYAFGGFMVGHASHVGMMNAAAWLPLVLLLLMRTLGERSVRFAIGCGVALGISMLAGHFQVSLYMILFVVLYGAWIAVGQIFRRSWRLAVGTIGLVALVGAFAGGIAAVQYLPTFQLVAQSERSAIPLSVAQSESLKPSALNGYLNWNYRGVAVGPYTGPWDRTQNYLFIGLSTLALAIGALAFGLRRHETRSLTAFFGLATITAVAYAVGPATPLHGLLYHVPLLGTVRAPGNMLLVAHLSLICLAALSWNHIPKRWLQYGAVAFLLIVLVELVPRVRANELLWARHDASEIFANAPIAQQVVREYSTLPTERRFRVWRVPGLETNEPQYWQIDDFGGYNPLEMRRHARYAEAMTQDLRLMALAGIKYAPCSATGGTQLAAPWAPGTCRLPSYLPRVFLVGRFQTADTPQAALDALKSVEPYSVAVVESETTGVAPTAITSSGPFGYEATIAEERPGFLRLNVKSSGDAIAVITQTYWPGWIATVDGVATPIWRSDYLFQGIRVSAGEHVVELSFRPRIFVVGLVATVMTLCAAIGAFVALRRAGPAFKSVV